jgi:phosphoglycolate phosphatase-like HAD superfamily hydrolase
MDDNTVAIVSLEGAIKRAVKQVRKALRNASEGSEFHFRIYAHGRVQEGETKLEISLADSGYSSGVVTGNQIQPVIDEYLRRHGWDKLNAPLQISFDGSDAAKASTKDEEIPF